MHASTVSGEDRVPQICNYGNGARAARSGSE